MRFRLKPFVFFFFWDILLTGRQTNMGENITSVHLRWWRKMANTNLEHFLQHKCTSAIPEHVLKMNHPFRNMYLSTAFLEPSGDTKTFPQRLHKNKCGKPRSSFASFFSGQCKLQWCRISLQTPDLMNVINHYRLVPTLWTLIYPLLWSLLKQLGEIIQGLDISKDSEVDHIPAVVLKMFLPQLSDPSKYQPSSHKEQRIWMD